jgi:hypothetical protein
LSIAGSRNEYRPEISAETLWDRYTSFGDDPFVVVVDGAVDKVTFSAWSYAKERYRATFGGPAAGD